MNPMQACFERRQDLGNVGLALDAIQVVQQESLHQKFAPSDEPAVGRRFTKRQRGAMFVDLVEHGVRGGDEHTELVENGSSFGCHGVVEEIYVFEKCAHDP